MYSAFLETYGIARSRHKNTSAKVRNDMAAMGRPQRLRDGEIDGTAVLSQGGRDPKITDFALCPNV
jgi:hypothetical protein